jgi:hypothetical protein
MELFVGCDLGQAQDFTALTVVERQRVPCPGTRRGTENHYHVRELSRAPLGMRYTDVVEDVKALLATPPLTPATPLIIDKTGVGTAVRDMFTQAGLRPYSITIHGGDSVIRDSPRDWKVPKRELASLLVSLYQGRRLHVAEGLTHAATLTREMAAFRVKVDLRTGHDSYEAWREHDHDDLVLAVALACWYGENAPGPARITWGPVDDWDVYETSAPAVSPHYWRYGRT